MWARLANVALGVWLMTSPSVLNYGEPASTNAWVVGPLVAMFACIAIWEATRGIRWLNFPLGFWLIVSPFIFAYEQAAFVNSIAVGCLVAALALSGGRIQGEYGGGWSALWRREEA